MSTTEIGRTISRPLSDDTVRDVPCMTEQPSATLITVSPRFPWYATVKFVMEYILAAILFVLALPFIGLAAVAIKLTSPGPIFYRQRRLGKYGRVYEVIKLRTMIHNAESATGPVWAKKKDSRITPIGNFLRNTHIDEFPQLINVLRGEMALIGPRPERPEIAEQLEWQVPGFSQRLAVRPGITGLAQLNLPPDSDIEGVRKKLLHDVYYITRCNPWLDIKIFYTTGWLLTKTIIKRVFRFAIVPDKDTIQLQSESMMNADSRLLVAAGKTDE